MKCFGCGRELPDEVEFCHFCGAKMEDGAVALTKESETETVEEVREGAKTAGKTAVKKAIVARIGAVVVGVAVLAGAGIGVSKVVKQQAKERAVAEEKAKQEKLQKLADGIDYEYLEKIAYIMPEYTDLTQLEDFEVEAVLRNTMLRGYQYASAVAKGIDDEDNYSVIKNEHMYYSDTTDEQMCIFGCDKSEIDRLWEVIGFDTNPVNYIHSDSSGETLFYDKDKYYLIMPKLGDIIASEWWGVGVNGKGVVRGNEIVVDLNDGRDLYLEPADTQVGYRILRICGSQEDMNSKSEDELVSEIDKIVKNAGIYFRWRRKQSSIQEEYYVNYCKDNVSLEEQRDIISNLVWYYDKIGIDCANSCEIISLSELRKIAKYLFGTSSLELESLFEKYDSSYVKVYRTEIEYCEMVLEGHILTQISEDEYILRSHVLERWSGPYYVNGGMLRVKVKRSDSKCFGGYFVEEVEWVDTSAVVCKENYDLYGFEGVIAAMVDSKLLLQKDGEFTPLGDYNIKTMEDEQYRIYASQFIGESTLLKEQGYIKNKVDSQYEIKKSDYQMICEKTLGRTMSVDNDKIKIKDRDYFATDTYVFQNLDGRLRLTGMLEKIGDAEEKYVFTAEGYESQNSVMGAVIEKVNIKCSVSSR